MGTSYLHVRHEVTPRRHQRERMWRFWRLRQTTLARMRSPTGITDFGRKLGLERQVERVQVEDSELAGRACRRWDDSSTWHQATSSEIVLWFSWDGLRLPRVFSGNDRREPERTRTHRQWDLAGFATKKQHRGVAHFSNLSQNRLSVLVRTKSKLGLYERARNGLYAKNGVCTYFLQICLDNLCTQT